MMMGLRASGLAAMAAVTAILLAGCGSTVKLDETPVETRTPNAVSSGVAGGDAASGASRAGSTAAAAPQTKVATVDLGNGAASKLGRVVYFDFDSFVVGDPFRSLIEGHAKQLAGARTKRMVVEGHTDERGGREYNLALGQKRADAVAKSLTLLGASESQVEAVSFGKERPVSEGHDEAAWAQNRRAEIKDR